MQDANKSVKKETSPSEAAVDAAIRAAGGEREAIRALLLQIAELRAAASANVSLGYRRGHQPVRGLP